MAITPPLETIPPAAIATFEMLEMQYGHIESSPFCLFTEHLLHAYCTADELRIEDSARTLTWEFMYVHPWETPLR